MLLVSHHHEIFLDRLFSTPGVNCPTLPPRSYTTVVKCQSRVCLTCQKLHSLATSTRICGPSVIYTTVLCQKALSDILTFFTGDTKT